MRRSLSAARSSEPVSAAKPTRIGRGVREPGSPGGRGRAGEDVLGRLEVDRQAFAAGQLRRGGPLRAEVGYGGGHHQDIDASRMSRTASRISAVVSTRTMAASLGRAAVTWPTTSVTPRAALDRGLGDGDAHLAGRSVADEPDGIDRLGGAARGDEDLPAGEVRLAGRLDPGRAISRIRSPDWTLPDGRDDGVDDPRQLREAPDADLPGRERPGVRLDDRVAEVVAQPADILPRRGMRPHLAVHRRRDDDGGGRSEGRRGDRVAREAVGHRPEPVGGRRGDDDRVGRVRGDDVADPAVRQEGQEVRLRRVPAQRIERERGDEAGGRRGEQDDDVGAIRLQEPEQLDGLVGSDRAGHAEGDEPAGEASGHRSSPSSSGSPPLTSAWRIARPLSVRSGSMASIPSRARAHGAADSPPVRIALTSAGSHARRVGELATDAGEQSCGQGLVAEDRSGLHRADRVAADRPVGRPELDPGQFRGPRGERLETELEAGGDRATDVRSVGRHAVERRRGPEVDDDGGRPVEPRGGQCVDEPVGTDFLGAVRPDRERNGPGTRDDEGPLPARGDRLDAGREVRDDGGAGDGGDVGERRVVEAQQAVEQQLELIGARPRVRRRPAGRGQGSGLEQPEGDIRVADVDGEQHGGIIRGVAAEPAGRRRRRYPGRTQLKPRSRTGTTELFREIRIRDQLQLFRWRISWYWKSGSTVTFRKYSPAGRLLR